MSTLDVRPDRPDRRSGLPRPWRRHQVAVDLAPLLAEFQARHRRADTTLIERAFDVARAAHADQVRRSGGPYLEHPLGVAMVIAQLGLDDITVAGALLHDAVEDTAVTVADIEARFGGELAAIVDGVTKLDRLQFDSREAQQAATLRKMLVAMASDIRVLLIKLADRLHNMRTIASLPEPKQRRIAQETLDIYAPLAHRLGIQELKWQLEDLAFEVLHRKRYAEIEQMVASRAPAREEELARVLAELRERLAELHIEAVVQGRRKHYWSIYEKMVVRGKEFDEVQDLVGVRVIVESVKDCYGALGSIHALWAPVQGRFKDYIAMPKFNLYQSLHTTVVGPGGKPVEVQIRTKEMHRRAEFGIAAHWGYKERSPAEDLAWLQRIVDWQQDTADPTEFMETLKVDLQQDEVFVFTPKGKVVTLPSGATPVDFAYAIHTEVGHRCVGARVNGRLVPLDSALASGDAVEIFTSKVEGAGPSLDWLQFAHTPRARSKIRQWFSRERRVDAMDTGREELSKALRKEGLPVQKLTQSDSLKQVAAALHYHDLDALYAAIGEGHVSARAVAQRVERELRGGEEQLPVTTTRPPHAPRAQRSRTVGVHVEGLDDVMVRLSRCCTPVPGDEIMGFVTRGRGVSVHRSDCANATALANQTQRVIEVEWDHDETATFVVSIEVEALDRARLLRDVAQVLAEHHVNILTSTSQTSTDRVAHLRFDFELADPSHLDSILRSVQRVDSVYEAYRLLPGHARN
ncbi:MAG TPA: bifunctional (p)ppGpp synthetase/guanosine-3',5'-bis(diphosphate) 3'-pyrophosphohydrolase [Acidimicrobiia bacterium]|jgi:GTP pyrophosphokinase|nr:bifunctional (p)ppGpp synthetase/guanosine-3',5'-bis(diphosphate) 3'-pyrophosphohydrolase [Acidimicrobiia bacterium]